jgi:hypothetical protein
MKLHLQQQHYCCNSPALRGANAFSDFEFNQAWLAEF